MRGTPQENRNCRKGTPNINFEECGRDAKGNSESLQFLAGLEAHGFAGRDADFLAGARVAADAGLARAHVEHAEAAQLDALAFAKRLFHGIEDGFNSLFGLGPAHSGLVYDGVYDVQLNHSTLQLSNGKLC